VLLLPMEQELLHLPMGLLLDLSPSLQDFRQWVPMLYVLLKCAISRILFIDYSWCFNLAAISTCCVAIS
jgi:hypothetical protein